MSEKKLFHEIPKSADFHSVVLTTYSFDFHHFESQVLRSLKSKGITNVTILADTVMLDQSIGFSTGQLKSLSSSYSINAIPCVGAFHPKLTILAGENDVLLLQGSGNITNGGHGKNHEVFSVFYANNEDQTQLPLIQEAWNYLRTITNPIEGLSSDKLNWVVEHCNLLEDAQIEKHQFHQIDENFSAALLYNEETSIWNQLTQLIPVEEIKNIKTFSPFYDEKGTFLKQLGDYFSSSTIEAFLQANKGIHPHKMDASDQVSFYSWESTDRAKESIAKYERKLHSKIIWLDGGEAQYGLFGSPNATIRAFGTNNARGANDEFAVIVKVKDQQIFEHLQLTGANQRIQPQVLNNIQAIEKEVEEEQDTNKRKIKVLGVDQDGRRITVFLKNRTDFKKTKLRFYNSWNEKLEEHLVALKGSKITIELKERNSINAVSFIQLFDENEGVISNKQIVNKLHDLWNTNPSQENRRLLKLGSLLESGNSKLFDVINYFNDIRSVRNKLPQKASKGSTKESVETGQEVTASISYEEAIQLDKQEKAYQHIFQQHNSIKIWDAIEHYFNQLVISEEEEDMDDEEDGTATTSRERKDKKPRTEPVSLNSDKVLQNRRRAFDKFLNNYLKGLKQAQSQSKHELGLVDMAMFLIVMKHLIEFTERKVTFKVEDENNGPQVLFPLLGNLSELSSFSGAILNLIGHFVNLIYKLPFVEINDEYLSMKLSHYKILVKRTALFSLALIKENYKHHENGEKWADILAYNIIGIFQKLEKGYEKQLEAFLDNSSLENKDANNMTGIIEKWQEDYDALKVQNNILVSEKFGVCEIVKKIPDNGSPKFLKLARPGFRYNEEENDFILEQLYNCKTFELQPSLQKFKKSNIQKS